MSAMAELENICIETCPDCLNPTCLTIVEEDGTALFICDNPECKANSIWEPRPEKIQTLLTMGLV